MTFRSQGIDRCPSCRPDGAQAAPASGCHAAQSNDGPPRMTQQHGKAHPPQNWRTGMRARRKNRRKQEKLRAGSLGAAYLRHIMHGGAMQQAAPDAWRGPMPPVPAICAPGPRHAGLPRQQQTQRPPPRNPAHDIKQGTSAVWRPALMTEDDARAARQAVQRPDQGGFGYPWIGHQP